MSDWEYYFPQNVRWDGQRLYQQGAVQNYNQVDKTTATAKVVDNPVGYVSVRKISPGQYDLHCSCENRTGRRYCKHLAAVLFFRDAQKAVLEAPLFDEGKRTSYFFNLGTITKNMKPNANTIEQAMELLNKNDVVLDSVDVTEDRDYFYNRKKEKMLVARGHSETEDLGIFVHMNQKEMLEMAAGWDHWYYQHSYNKNYEVGKISSYMIALLYLLDGYIRKYDPGDSTDEAGMKLIRNFAKFRAGNKIENNDSEKRKIVLLTPKIELDYGLYVTFKIGVDKKYVIKDLSELIDAKERNGAFKLGKKNQISFMDETFTDTSQKYYDFIKRQINQRNLDVETQYGRMREGESVHDKYVTLLGRTLDEFYEIAKGQSFECKNIDGGPATIKVMEAPYHVNLNVHSVKQEKNIKGIKVDVDCPEMYQGAKQNYFVHDGFLSPIKFEDEVAVKPIFSALGDTYGSFEIGQKNLSEFVYRILPYLRENPVFNIDDTGLEESSLPEEAIFTFYLDVEDGMITCKGDVSYSDNKQSLKVLEDKDFPLAKYRDISAEEEVIRNIEQYFQNYDANKLEWSTEKDDQVMFDLLNEGIQNLMAYGEVVGTDAFSRLRIRKTTPFTLGVSLENGLMEIEVMNSEISEEELLHLLSSYQKKKKYHRLSNGEFVSLEEDETLETLEELMNTLGVTIQDFTDGKLEQPLYRALYVNKVLEEHDAIALDRDRNFKNLIRNFKSIGESDIEIPSEIKSQLREYQKYGVRWMATLCENGFGGILADDMGLGKTIQMIALLDAKKEELKEHPAVIITPASVVYNWEEEFHRFAPSLKVAVLAGSKKARKEILTKSKDSEVFIVSYDTAKRDVDLFKDMTFSFEVLDEGQYIKNIKADVTKAVKIIHSTHRFVLTGTPIENRLSELWSIFDYLMPGFLFSYEQFRSRFEVAIAKDKDALATEGLKKMVSPFILRRLKKDVLKDLPEKIEEIRYARFEDKQRKLYDGQIVHMKEIIRVSTGQENKIKILAELMRLRQICCDPSLVIENYDGASAKKEACVELLKNAIDGGHRILVFSQFTSMLELLEKELQKEDISYYKITGATSKEERMKLVHSFNESNEVPVFLVSLKAGGTGLNLVGADVVIHYDPWWNLAAQNQATDRAHRIGQKNTVTVYKLIIKDSIEEKIMEIQNMKKDLADAVLNGDSTSITSLSAEELMELLS